MIIGDNLKKKHRLQTCIYAITFKIALILSYVVVVNLSVMTIKFLKGLIKINYENVDRCILGSLKLSY